MIAPIDRLVDRCRHFRSDRAGNIALTAALVIPIVVAGIGASIDYSLLVQDKSDLQASLDAAAVATASSLGAGHGDENTAPAYAKKFFFAAMADSISTAQKTELESRLATTVTKTTAGAVKTYKVKMTASYTAPMTPLAKFLEHGNVAIGATSSAQTDVTSKTAMSMYLVLDRSGSMSFVTDTNDATKTRCPNYTEDNWRYYPYLPSSAPCFINKMSALKAAAATLFGKLDDQEDLDSSDTLIRVGGVSFNDNMQTPTSIAWGTSSIRNYVSSLPAYPTGGTDMTDGMEQAYTSLNASSETTAQSAKGNATYFKFIILMTDGENTGSSSNWQQNLDSQTLATCTKARNAGMTIFSVAFMAPDRGKTMLKSCAGDLSNYFVAEDMAGLLAAFSTIGAKASKLVTRITE